MVSNGHREWKSFPGKVSGREFLRRSSRKSPGESPRNLLERSLRESLQEKFSTKVLGETKRLSNKKSAPIRV